MLLHLLQSSSALITLKKAASSDVAFFVVRLHVHVLAR